MNAPTIGRIVWVRVSGKSETFPAIVHAVHGEKCISVNYFSFDGSKVLSSVMQDEGLDGDNPTSTKNCWDWMPYQKAVAAERASEGKPDLNAAGSS